MKIALDRQSSEPVYLQIRNRISRLIETGGVKPGDRLPSIRALAHSSQVNKLTVIEAYSVLEADGLIHARQGAGYYINRPSAQPNTESTFAPTQEVIIPEKGMNSFLDIHNAALQAQTQKDFINFSCGFPQASGVEDLQRIARRAVKESMDDLFRHNHPQGQPKLRSQIAQLLVQHGLEISPENLILTNGSMQALALLAQHYIQPGDWVIVEAPTFYGFLSILQQAGARAIGIPMTAEGVNLQLLEQYLQSHRPKLIYTISSLHNPTGITTGIRHRRQLLALAEQYNCWVVEDNAYEWLAFDPTPPPIKAFDPCDRVIYLGTFSKTLMPGLRVGYMVVTGEDYQPLAERKLLHDMHVSVVSQAIISEYLASGRYRRRLNHLRALNQQNRNIMLQALERYFPADASWTIPNGGLFLWVHLPKTVSMSTLCREAVAEKVLISSGSAFFADQQGYSALRLNFAQSPEEIQRGVEILGRVIAT